MAGLAEQQGSNQRDDGRQPNLEINIPWIPEIMARFWPFRASVATRVTHERLPWQESHGVNGTVAPNGRTMRMNCR